ncbi:GNAT family N-acetyltransferase [Kushneria aurantia]|uniref:GNAT family N-acetyltransferase n=1 Tax=Kushneria aurantia TaxID=504092 RepID=A0ABV6G073_9GAMM|nr:GNAT family N-acetyltransferase [Kushneria aurantia]
MQANRGSIDARDISTRPATEQDALYILDLEERCMREYALALWGEWRGKDADDLYLDRFCIVEYRQARAGCIATINDDTQCWIDRFYIEPTLQGQGVGGILLARLTSAADARGVPTRLSVLAGNPAINFYRRHGFMLESETAERRRMVRHPA